MTPPSLESLTINRQFPASLLYRLRTSLDDEFCKLPKRIQEGYTVLLWSNLSVTDTNRHIQEKDSWKVSTKQLKVLFGKDQVFRDVNTNGYYMNQKRTTHGDREGHFKICKSEDIGAIEHPPTGWVNSVFTGYGTPKIGGKGVLSAYQIAPNVQAILDEWGDSSKPLEDIPSGFGISYSNLENIAKEKIQPEEVNILVRINFMSLKEYQYQLEIIQEEFFKKKGVSEALKGSTLWNDIVRFFMDGDDALEERMKGPNDREDKGWGIVTPKVNTKPLQVLLRKDLTKKNISQQLSYINKILLAYREENFKGIPMTYEVVSTGRLFATNATLQGYNKEVRYAALQGCFAYDMESAHQSILLQLLEEEGADFTELDVLREYVNEKKAVRERLSKELGLPIKAVKDILQALTYGARLSRSRNEAVYKACSGDMEAVEKVVTHPWLRQYQQTFNQAHEILLGNKKTFKNIKGLPCKKTSKPARLAHLLQGHERFVIDALIKRSEKGMVALLLHDAIVFYGKAETEQLEEFVRHDTGFNLRFSEEAY